MNESTSDLVTIEQHEHVRVVRLNRPDKHNALSLDMFDAIIAAGESLLSDQKVRAVVLCGEGPSFCAGLDFSAMQSLLQSGEAAAASLSRLFHRDNGPDNVAQRVAYIWRKLDVPVIAALHGAVYGGGFQIALGADFRFAHPSTKFSVMEIRYGLIPDMAITQTLPDLLPLDKALELTLTGRVFRSEEAASLGIVTAVTNEPLELATNLAQEIAAKSPNAVKAVKQLFREGWRCDARTSLTLEESLQRKLIGSPEQIEAVTASVEKRPAKFK